MAAPFNMPEAAVQRVGEGRNANMAWPSAAEAGSKYCVPLRMLRLYAETVEPSRGSRIVLTTPFPSVSDGVQGPVAGPRSAKLPAFCAAVGTIVTEVVVAGLCLVYSWEKKKNNFFFWVLNNLGMYTGPPTA